MHNMTLFSGLCCHEFCSFRSDWVVDGLEIASPNAGNNLLNVLNHFLKSLLVFPALNEKIQNMCKMGLVLFFSSVFYCT